ncbi:MAG: hypothetical protein KME15_06250 [Drouetiella hepatica Uher 2000/2452]|jgi:hypothetical protein|uniref:Uncharacterized protein n=1 Tax=Drouetiella hepatica Uher 2000/2452 TaxID=904376 RepID=A0A951Q8T8_9CYAN|nr:hypothetical protein [Drouetiella hepatica Uher 2000/2452]
MNANSDTTAAIDSLESLLKAKIKLQDAQSEAEPLLKVIGLLFEPEALDDDQKKVLQNGLKSLRKLLEAHSAYSVAVEQAEPARAIVNQLLSFQPMNFDGKPTGQPSEESVPKVTTAEAIPDEVIADEDEESKVDEAEDKGFEADEAVADLSKVSATTKSSGSTRATSSKKS